VIAAERRQLLAQRRGLLIQRAALQRQALGAAAAPLLPAWQAAECGLLLWRGVRQRPWLLALPLGVLLVWRPRVGSGLALLPLAWRVWSRIARS
jgi:hypothetical protein